MIGHILNPNEEAVNYIKRQVKDNNGYCICEDEHNKATKCPKACKRSGVCLCGMYVPDDEPVEYDLD